MRKKKGRQRLGIASRSNHPKVWISQKTKSGTIREVVFKAAYQTWFVDAVNRQHNPHAPRRWTEITDGMVLSELDRLGRWDVKGSVYTIRPIVGKQVTYDRGPRQYETTVEQGFKPWDLAPASEDEGKEDEEGPDEDFLASMIKDKQKRTKDARMIALKVDQEVDEMMQNGVTINPLLRKMYDKEETATNSPISLTKPTRSSAPESKFSDLKFVPGANNAHTAGRTIDPFDRDYNGHK